MRLADALSVSRPHHAHANIAGQPVGGHVNEARYPVRVGRGGRGVELDLGQSSRLDALGQGLRLVHQDVHAVRQRSLVGGAGEVAWREKGRHRITRVVGVMITGVGSGTLPDQLAVTGWRVGLPIAGEVEGLRSRPLERPASLAAPAVVTPDEDAYR